MRAKDRYGLHHSKKQSPLLLHKQLLHKALGSGEATPSWKILVFDAYNRALVSSQLKMKDLRDQNITLYLNLKDERQQIHGVTVLYMVQPTPENVDIIAKDLMEDMYTSVNIHFSSEPLPGILSALAKKLGSSKKTSVISKVSRIEYSCFGFYPIDHSMCVLPSEAELVNMLAAMSYQPIFVYNAGVESALNLVKNVKSKLASIMDTFNSQGSSNSNPHYAIVYIFNRETDYFPLLAHGITYASLVENIYKVNKTGNKLIKGYGKESEVELSLQDEIWVEKKNYLISEMQLQEESRKIESRMIGLSHEEYTEQNEKYKKIEWHLNNAGQMITEAKKRRLNEFYEIEQELYYKGLVSGELKRDIITLLKQGDNSEDKVRLLLIYMLFVENIDQFPQFEQAFPDIAKNKKYTELKDKKLRGSVVESTSNKYLKKFAKGIWKNLVTGDKKFRLTKQFERVKSCSFAELSESDLTVEGLNPLSANLKIQRNIVYCIGGVCFHEYANVMEFDPEALYTGDRLISYRDVI